MSQNPADLAIQMALKATSTIPKSLPVTWVKKMTVKEFGDSVKTKYPEYKDYDSEEIGRKMLAKYPEYSDKVDQWNKLLQWAKDAVWAWLTSTTWIPKFVGEKVWEGVGYIAKKFGADENKTDQLVNSRKQSLSNNQDIGQNKDSWLYKWVKMAADLVNTAVPIWGWVKVASKVGQATSKLPGWLSNIWKGAIEWAKDVTRYNLVSDSKLPEVEDVTIWAAIWPAIYWIGAWAKFVGSKINPDVDTLISKAIRPSVSNKSRIWDVAKYNSDVLEWVKSIVSNKNNIKLTDDLWDEVIGKLPESLNDWAVSIKQQKDQLWQSYMSKVNSVGSQWAKVNTMNIISELKKLTKDRTIDLKAPWLKTYIIKRITELSKLKSLSAEDAQEVMKTLNNQLEVFYKNPNSNDLGKTTVDALINNVLKKDFDDTISWFLWSMWAKTERQLYGKLTNIEKDVVKRAIVDARKNNKWLLDFTDIFSAWDIVASIATWTPALAAKWLVQMWIKNWFKYLNDPNTSVKKLFQLIDKWLPVSK